MKRQPADKRTFLEVIQGILKVNVPYIVLPSSASAAERSFSTLRKLKTYLRSTRTQQRLNNLAILNTHREHAEALDLAEAVSEFVSRSQTRCNKFGLSS